MKSEDKITVEIRPIEPWPPRDDDNEPKKDWVFIGIKDSWTGKVIAELVPSFEDWFRIIRALMICEKKKYPRSPDPLRIPREFFNDCFNESLTWEEIRVKHKIPKRD